MKYALFMLIFIGAMVSAETMNPHSLPTGAIGILHVDRLTQGKLLWMQGRVGQGVYTTTNQAGQHCSITVPVAVGQIEQSGFGIDSVTGLSIIVMNPTLSAAMINGDRIRSDEWRFSTHTDSHSVDGYITQGIKESEGFVLNAKRRWLSWLLEDSPELHCH